MAYKRLGYPGSAFEAKPAPLDTVPPTLWIANLLPAILPPNLDAVVGTEIVYAKLPREQLVA